MPQTGPAPQPPNVWRRRAVRWALRSVSLVLILCTGAILYLAFPPNGQPVPVAETVRARIEAAIDSDMPGGEVSIGEIGLSLSRGQLMPRVRFTDMRLSEADGDRIHFPILDVELDRAGVLQGQIRPRRVVLRDAGLLIRRNADGSFDMDYTGTAMGEARDLTQMLAGVDRMFADPVFSAMERVSGEGLTVVIEDAASGDSLQIDEADLSLVPSDGMLSLSVGGQVSGRAHSALDLSFTRRADAGQTAFSARFESLHSEDIAFASDALAWLTLVDAPLSGQLSTVLFDDGRVGTLSGTLDVGAGRLVPGGGVAPLPLTSMSLAFDYDAAAARMWIERFEVEAPALSARISGHATLLDGPVYQTQLQISEITADPPGLFAAPLRFDGGALDFRLQLEPVVAVEVGQAVLFDERLHLRARGRIAAEEAGLAVRLDTEVPRIAAARVPGFWPVDLLPNTRRWIAERILAGEITNLHAGLRLVPDNAPQFGLTFDFDGARVRALRGMGPVQAGRGYLDISHNRVAIALHEGHVMAPDGGRLDLAGSLMRIHDTRQRFSPATLDLEIAGDIPSALTLIAADPFNLLDRFPLDPATVARGRADIAASVDMVLQPRITPEDLTFAIAARLAGVASDQLVPGRVLNANALRLEADNDQLSIAGRARLDGVPIDATWTRALGPDTSFASTVTGTATLTPQALAGFGLRLPEGMLAGSGQADFTLNLGADQPPRLSLRSDLAGLALSVPALGWSLPTASTGRLEAEVTLGSAPDVPLLEIEGAGLSLLGNVTLDDAGALDRLRIERLQVGDWLDVSGSLIGQGQVARLEVTGGRADMRGLPTRGGVSGTGDPVPLDLRLDRFDISDTIFLTNLRAALSGRPMGGDFRGRVGGEVPVTGTLVGEEDGTSLRLRADDGGAVLRAAGVYPNSYGGTLDLILRPLSGEGRYSGLLTIDNPRLRDAPAFAELLSAVSVVGLLEQMASGEGVALGSVRAVFSMAEGQVVIREGTALGPAMGLSLDGVYDIATRYFDFEGVVSPFYLVNGMMGGIFSARREGLFGFTYRLTGTPDDSTVSVNPLSVFTPGIFREIFRRPPPELAQ